MSSEPVNEQLEVRQASSFDKMMVVIERVASDPNFNPEALHRLLDLQERIMTDQRATAFKEAMARLQEKLPQMDKYGQAKNSKYAKLEDIDTVIRPLLAEEGFSFSFDEEAHTDKTITFVAILSHREGHSETKRLTVPIDAASKNREGVSIRPAIQDMGSTVSYARRYLIKMALNIVEKDEDTDGNPTAAISEDQTLNIEALISEVGADRKRFLAYMKVSEPSAIRAHDYVKAVAALEQKRKQEPKPFIDLRDKS